MAPKPTGEASQLLAVARLKDTSKYARDVRAEAAASLHLQNSVTSESVTTKGLHFARRQIGSVV